MRNVRFFFRIGIFVAVMAGCQNADKAVLPTAPSDTADGQKVLLAAQETLAAMHFEIEKFDPQSGYLRTRPLRGGQFFEPWRQDNATLRDYARSNIDTLRRTVEIFAPPQGQSGEWQCVVHLEKLYLPSAAIRGATHFAHLYSQSRRTSVLGLTLSEQAEQGAEWLPLGDDEALQARIIRRIEQKLAHAKPNADA